MAICVHEFVGLRRPFATEYSRNNADLLKTIHPTTRQNLNSYTSEVQQGLIPDFKAKILPKAGESKYVRDAVRRAPTWLPSARPDVATERAPRRGDRRPDVATDAPTWRQTPRRGDRRPDVATDAPTCLPAPCGGVSRGVSPRHPGRDPLPPQKLFALAH
jgi:hypothetical protein